MKVHPVAEAYPMPDASSILDLVASIKRVGQITPVVMLGNELLDGRCRVKACKLAGREPNVIQYKGKKDLDSLIAFVDGCNDKRRHLTTSQRAAVAVELTKIGMNGKAPATGGGETGAKSANLHFSQDAASKKLGVSVRATKMAAKVAKADPKAFEEVKAGKKSLNKAHSELPVQPKKEAPPANGTIAVGSVSSHPLLGEWEAAFGKLKRLTGKIKSAGIVPVGELVSANNYHNLAYSEFRKWKP